MIKKCSHCGFVGEETQFYSKRHSWCKKCSCELSKNYYKIPINREKKRIYAGKWRAKNPEKDKINRKNCYKRAREKVFLHYGGVNLKCVCCGEKERGFLTIDHINNDGSVHRKITKNLYYWLVSHNFPEGFQVLCFNCNLGKGIYGKCPHVK